MEMLGRLVVRHVAPRKRACVPVLEVSIPLHSASSQPRRQCAGALQLCLLQGGRSDSRSSSEGFVVHADGCVCTVRADPT